MTTDQRALFAAYDELKQTGFYEDLAKALDAEPKPISYITLGADEATGLGRLLAHLDEIRVTSGLEVHAAVLDAEGNDLGKVIVTDDYRHSFILREAE